MNEDQLELPYTRSQKEIKKRLLEDPAPADYEPPSREELRTALRKGAEEMRKLSEGASKTRLRGRTVRIESSRR